MFPQFGQPNKDMPQHGFLRCNYWKCGDVFDDEEAAGCDFTLALEDVVNARGEGIWKDESTVDCTIVFSIKLNGDSLTTMLTIENAGGTTFDYQTLFHTYFKIYGSKALEKDVCNVTGLGGYQVYDQVAKSEYVQDENPIFVDREVDCIFTTPEGKTNLDVLVCTGEDGSKVSVKAKATMDGEELPVSVVVWNPFIEKSKMMGDFGDVEYHDMLCVEPGVLQASQQISSGKKVIFSQTITTL